MSTHLTTMLPVPTTLLAVPTTMTNQLRLPYYTKQHSFPRLEIMSQYSGQSCFTVRETIGAERATKGVSWLLRPPTAHDTILQGKRQPSRRTYDPSACRTHTEGVTPIKMRPKFPEQSGGAARCIAPLTLDFASCFRIYRQRHLVL